MRFLSSHDRSPSSLVIAEKPDAARRIASALGRFNSVLSDGIEYYDVQSSFNEKHYIVCAAAGHLYTISDQVGKRRVYPVFDSAWFPTDLLLSRTRKFSGRKITPGFRNLSSRRIRVVKLLSKQVTELVHACDYDIEGETIGSNIIKFALSDCPSSRNVWRARFSTLTQEEIRRSFLELDRVNPCLADAGRTRHEIDFLWGVNLSRALSEASRFVANEFQNRTIGRVQGPTLAFVVDRDLELETHVPLPYWTLSLLLEKGNIRFEANYENQKIETKFEADKIYSAVSKESFAKVSSCKRNKQSVKPPYPFNLGDLQREAYRIYKFSPALTLSIAEKLYLSALISYPRTNSQKLPPSIGYSKIIQNIVSQPEYSKYSLSLAEVTRRRFPIEGFKEDPAHPAIYPTSVKPAMGISLMERKIYDLIVRRFCACFMEDSIVENVIATLVIAGFVFFSSCLETFKRGWKDIYYFYRETDTRLPELSEGEAVNLLSANLDLRHTTAPPRYSQGTLLQKMESDNIGTKATRAETISTLLDRGYITETKTRSLQATELGRDIVEALRDYCEQIVSVDLTRKTEESIESIAYRDEDGRRVRMECMKDVLFACTKLHEREFEIGQTISASKEALQINSRQRSKGSSRFRNTTRKLTVLGKCPRCSNGNIIVIRSPKSHKRFLGCSNYEKGCKTSTPLPQKGIIQKTSKVCSHCEFPIVEVKFSYRSRPWEMCPNPTCASKRKEEVLNL